VHFCLAVEIITCFNALKLDKENECVTSLVLTARKVLKRQQNERENNGKLEKNKFLTFPFRKRRKEMLM